MSFREKIIPWPEIAKWRLARREREQRLVVTNGCFDILHVGHVSYLEAARAQGDALLVGLTSDRWVRDIKGPGRPINEEKDRAAMLAALQSVDGVCIFPDKTALNFLATVKPDIYVKGGDYSLDTLVQEERRMLEQAGVKIVLLPLVPGKSTTALLEKIASL
jgi:D-glycero-beta-D-manno-heptose 1-phosphate adenylyltransferase